MSRGHFSNDRKRQSNALHKAFVELYEDYWSPNIDCFNFQNGVEYPKSDQEKTLTQIHDLMGADRLILRETEHGSAPIFVEEKTRTFKREKLSKPYYNGPFDEDLALTWEYHNKKNQPKHRKHLEQINSLGFVPTLLSYIIHDPEDSTVIRSYLIDYYALLAIKSQLDYAEVENHSDGNTTHYIPQIELIQNDVVLHTLVNDSWHQDGLQESESTQTTL